MPAGVEKQEKDVTAGTTLDADDYIRVLKDVAGVLKSQKISTDNFLRWLTPGWTPVADTWTYASATTINIPTDGTTVYQKGDRIRFKQGGDYKYGTVYTVAATLLTLIPNADYSVANAAITDIAFSRVDKPFGFPVLFNWTPTLAGFSADPTGGIYQFMTVGDLMTCHIRQPNNGTSNATTFTISSPVAAATITNMKWVGLSQFLDNSVLSATPGDIEISSAAVVFNMFPNWANGTWTNSGGKRTAAASITFKY